MGNKTGDNKLGTLYTYWRSTAAYRVRIALNLKKIKVDYKYINLLKRDNYKDNYLQLNPGAKLPLLVLNDGGSIAQSLAIIEYLDEVFPHPKLLPQEPLKRAQIRAAAQIIACDVHPLNNIAVINYLKNNSNYSQANAVTWMHHWMLNGLKAYQETIDNDTRFSFGNEISLADIVLIPQLYNAHRWQLDITGLKRLLTIEQNCMAIDAFDQERPEKQKDAT